MSLAGYSPWGHKESDTTEQLTDSIQYDQTSNTEICNTQRKKSENKILSVLITRWKLEDFCLYI